MHNLQEARSRRAERVDTIAAPVGGAAKRAVDIALAMLALIALLPLLVTVALIVRAADGGPALYRQRRVGCDGRPFDCLKFRTMAPNADELLHRHLEDPVIADEWQRTRKLKRDPRITPLGVVLRRTSVDELPQLLNVLRGEMSLVGPRPIVEEEIARYGAAIQHYYRARPGLTGAWQISGRSDVGYSDRIRLDCDYVANWSLQRDIAIIVRTVPVVLTQRGSY